MSVVLKTQLVNRNVVVAIVDFNTGLLLTFHWDVNNTNRHIGKKLFKLAVNMSLLSLLQFLGSTVPDRLFCYPYGN